MDAPHLEDAPRAGKLCVQEGALTRAARSLEEQLTSVTSEETNAITVARDLADDAFSSNWKLAGIIARGVLSRSGKAASGAVRVLAADSVPQEAKATIFKELANCRGDHSDAVTVALVLAGVLPVCMLILSQSTSTPSLLRGCRLFLRSCGGKPALEAALRDAIRDELGLGADETPDSGFPDLDERRAVKASRLLSALAGRSVDFNGYATYHEPFLLKTVADTPGVLDLILSALQSFPPQCISEGMTDVIAGLCFQKFEKLLLAKGLAKLLLELANQLSGGTHDWKVLEAVVGLSGTPCGQEALWEMNTVALLSALIRNTKDDRVTVQGARALGRLGAHPAARTSINELVHEAATADLRSDCAVISLLGEVIGAAPAAARAAEHAGVLKVVEPAIEAITSTSDGHQHSTSLCMCISALMTHGTRSCQVHIARETQAVANLVRLLRSDTGNAEGWKAVASLMVVPEAVNEAVDMRLAELLPQGLAAEGSAAYFASKALEILCTIDAGAEASLAAGVLEALALLVKSDPVDATDAERTTDMSWLAAGWLVTTCDLAGGDTREHAAASCFFPILELSSQPWTFSSGLMPAASSRLLHMHRSAIGAMPTEQTLHKWITYTLTAIRKMQHVVAKNMIQGLKFVGRTAELVASAEALCCFTSPFFNTLMEQGLPVVLCNALKAAAAKNEAATLALLQCAKEVCRSRRDGAGKLVAAGIIPLLGLLMSSERMETAALVACILCDVTSVVGSSSELLRIGALGKLRGLMQKCPCHPAAEFASAAMYKWLDYAAGRGETDVTSAFENAGVHKPLLEILQSHAEAASLDFPVVKWAARLLGRLGGTQDGRAAIAELLQITKDELVALNALCNISMTDEGRAAALTVDFTLELLGASLAPGGLKSLLTIRTIRNFCDGSEACRRAVMPLLSKVSSLLSEPTLERDVRVSLAEVMASLARGGASGLVALKQIDAFPALIPIARASSMAGDDPSTCIQPCAQILQNALTLDSTKEAANTVISELVRLLPDAGDADLFSTSASDIRFSASFMTQLGSGSDNLQQDVLSASAAISVICAQGAPRKLLSVLATDDRWPLMRTSIAKEVADAFMSILNAPDGMAIAQDADALCVILKQVRTCQGTEISSFISLLQNFSKAEHDDYRNAMVEAGVLGQLLPFLEAGPASSPHIYGMCVCVLHLLVLHGNSAHCEAALTRDIVEALTMWSSRQWWYDSVTSFRVYRMLGRCSSDVPGISNVIKTLVNMLSEGHPANLQPTLSMMEAMAKGAFQASEPAVGLFEAVSPIVALMQSKGHQTLLNKCLCVLYRLAVLEPARVIEAAGTCAKLVFEGVDNKQAAISPAAVLGSLASASAQANAAICSMVSRMTESQEGVENGRAVVVAQTLSHMCHRPEGARAAMSAGVVPKTAKLLTTTLSRDLQEAALKLLVVISEHFDSARLAIRDAGLITIVVDLLTAGNKEAASAKVASTALELLLVLSESEALHLALQAASPLPALADLCEHNSTERSTALRALANLYCEGLEVVDKARSTRDDNGPDNPQRRSGIDDDYSRAREILSQYHIEARVTSSITDGIKKILFGAGPRPLRSILASVRSLSINEAQRKKLVGAGAGRSLVQVFLTEGHPRDGLTSVDLALAADCLRRCAYTPELRPSLLQAGAREALEKAAERGRHEGDEGGLQLEQAAKSALAALRGDLDIIQGPSDLVSGGANAEHTPVVGDECRDDELARLPFFNSFISHKRSDAQDFARTLHTILVTNGLSCFLDVDNLEELKDLELIVASVEVLIFVLTDNIFGSYWCLQELAAAVKAGVPIILVTKEGARWDDQSATSPFPPETLIASLEPPECRQAFTTKALSHNNEYFHSFIGRLLNKVRRVVDANSSAYPPKDGLPSGQLAAQLQRRRLLDARRKLTESSPAPAMTTSAAPTGTASVATQGFAERDVAHPLQVTAGASPAEQPKDEEHVDDEEDNKRTSSLSCASSSASHRSIKPQDRKRGSQHLRTAAKPNCRPEIAQPPGSGNAMEAPSPVVLDEILQLRQQVQRLMEQQAEPVPLGGPSCCVFNFYYCCNVATAACCPLVQRHYSRRLLS